MILKIQKNYCHIILFSLKLTLSKINQSTDTISIDGKNVFF